MRISSYDIYPGNNQILSNNSVFITTQSFNFLNQGVYTEYSINHTAGKPRLYMAWVMDAFEDAQRDTTWYSRYDDKGSSYPLPSASYYYFESPPTVFTTFRYDIADSRMTNNTFTMQHYMLDSAPATVYRDYIHLVTFEDAFDAPFVSVEVI